ncbi:hypothetical protein GYMLUDRAFT_253292 [Collybiopsis luxurians FD-317 M1]|uniref:Uncharacterized protein n=1 Tax=Collybiopsis luxurians FD-317 M1 TaxID=944289 RepID=A0A0D0C5U5_9AGAR|nr:hypothetical protein GYMLUDRAFT_253292 [Collybiopsis luxurians FD-317 M1]
MALVKAIIINCEKWRKEFRVDDIVKNFDFPEKEEVDKYYPQFYHKMDKDGHPIYIEQLRKLDFKALYACMTQDRLLKHLHPAPFWTSLSNFYHVKDYVMAASFIDQDRYPELGKFYIIDAPWFDPLEISSL